MKVLTFPLDNRLSVSSQDFIKLLEMCNPENLIYPKKFEKIFSTFNLDYNLFSYSHMDTFSIPLKRKFEKCEISSEFSKGLTTMRIGSKSITPFIGSLTLRDGIYKLNNNLEQQRVKNIPVLSWGSPTCTKIIESLKHLYQTLEIFTDEVNSTLTIIIPLIEAKVITSSNQTTIIANDLSTRRKIKDLISSECYPKDTRT